MRKVVAENERMKRKYLIYLREAKGRDQKTIDKVAAALVKFEESTGWKPFKRFKIDQASLFKKTLSKGQNSAGKPFSLTTIDANLRMVKGFFHWLAGQSGYKKVLSYSDVEYFNNNLKDARAAHTQRKTPFPSIRAAEHAFEAMPFHTPSEKRDKAIFAFLMLTGARDGAAASFRLKHVNLIDRFVIQDGREVKTKNAKTIHTSFFPVNARYYETFSEWVNFLKIELMFSAEDALFPRPERRLINGKFNFDKLSRNPYANGQHINTVIKKAFAEAQLPTYNAHSIRKTLTLLLNDLELTLEQQKAWSQNLGHENFVTTVTSYLPVSTERQMQLIADLSKGLPEHLTN